MPSAPLRASLAAVLLAALALTACSSAAPRPTVTVTVEPTPEAIAPLTVDDLLSAPVPSACDHPAGNLVDGVLPGIDRSNGIVSLNTGDPVGSAIAFNPEPNENGVAAVATLSCDQGGVTWPMLLVAYSVELEILASFDARNYTAGPNDDFTGLTWDSADTVSFTWSTHRYGEPSAAGTLESRETLTFDEDGSTITISTPEIVDVAAVSQRFIDAVAANDAAAMTELSANDRVVGSITADPKTRDFILANADARMDCIDRGNPSTPDVLANEFGSDPAQAYACFKAGPNSTYPEFNAPTLMLVSDGNGGWLVQRFIVYWY